MHQPMDDFEALDLQVSPSRARCHAPGDMPVTRWNTRANEATL
jgi:hypothetical protein